MSIVILEIGSEDFNALQARLKARAEQRDVPLGGKPGEMLQAAMSSGDSEFAEFAQKFYEGLHASALATVDRVIQAVEQQRDEAVRHLSRLFDGKELPTAKIRVSKLELMQAADAADETVLKHCREQILPRLRAFHDRQKLEGFSIDEHGGGVGIRVQPLGRVGIYVPGGTAFYPSTLMMTAVPAQAAGVPEIAVFTPPGALESSPLLAALLLELKLEEVYRVGGAQAVAAAAVGTEKIAKVDKFVGPGNIFVALAKQLLAHRMGIDSFAGPSEVVVIFDSSADPAIVAADLLAQAEHDVHAASIGITDSNDHAEAVKAEVEKQLATLPRKDIAAASLQHYGGLLVVPSKGFAFRLADSLAPEHCEVITRESEKDAALVRNAGAVFVGAYAPEAFGDYNAGPNHVLPTAGSARWASALGVPDFLRQVSIIRGSKELLAANKAAAVALARAEGLEGHARSIERRF
ncbi:MAG: histidinol dehydrogenase [Planctomycetes bacterium]|nr:histidinol dehydrogenase [Planctomycetota bacterium]MCW8134804.1 histidinol dehydrogenase [Planctomycetota bacterium]